MFIQVATMYVRMIRIAGQGMAGQHFLLTAGISSHAFTAHVI